MTSIFLVIFLHVFWTAILYALLTVFRAPKVWNIGVNRDGSNPFAAIEPKVSANLSNQFEWPLFFHVAAVLLINSPHILDSAYIVLAWIFIVGRVLHSLVQILMSNIRLRGLVFTINYLAVLAIWVLLLLDFVVN